MLLDRCTNLGSLQLINIYLENDTLQIIASSCPKLQRLTLTGMDSLEAFHS